MKSLVIRLLFAAAVAALSIVPASAAPNFAAAWDVAGVSPDGGVVHLTLGIEVRNLEAEDVHARTVYVADFADAKEPYARFDADVVPAKGSLRRTAAVDLPAKTWESWKDLDVLPVFVVTVDDDGTVNRIRVDALREPNLL